jgi:hypothetical protein
VSDSGYTVRQLLGGEEPDECTCIDGPELDDSGELLHASYCMTFQRQGGRGMTVLACVVLVLSCAALAVAYLLLTHR